MAAPTKEGLDYFSFDVDLLDNDGLDYLREQYGVVVNDVYIALLTLLYRKKGYYIPYGTKAEQSDCVWYIYKRVRGGRHPVQQELIPKVIEALVAQGLFDSTRFNQNDHTAKIITSERAQKTYYKATVERKPESFNIIPEYWLLDDETMRKLSKTHPYYLSLHSENKSGELLSKSVDLLSKSDEKPLKKSKVNNIYNVSKKVSNKKKIQSYDEIFEDFGVSPRLRESLVNFIRHSLANGVVIINDRLEGIIVALDMKYGKAEALKAQEVDTAITCGYVRLPCEGKE